MTNNTIIRNLIIAALVLVTVAAAVGLVVYISSLKGKEPKNLSLGDIVVTQENTNENETDEDNAPEYVITEASGNEESATPVDTTTATKPAQTTPPQTINIDEPDNIPSLDDLITPKPENTQPPVVTTKPETTTPNNTEPAPNTTKPAQTTPPQTTNPPQTTPKPQTTKPSTEPNGFPSNPSNGDIFFDNDGKRYLYDPWMGWIEGSGETHLDDWSDIELSGELIWD